MRTNVASASIRKTSLTDKVLGSTELMRALAHCAPGLEDCVVSSGLAHAQSGSDRSQRLRGLNRLAAHAVATLVAGFDGSPQSIGYRSMHELRRQLFMCIGTSWCQLIAGFGNTNRLLSAAHTAVWERLHFLAADERTKSSPHLAMALEACRDDATSMAQASYLLYLIQLPRPTFESLLSAINRSYESRQIYKTDGIRSMTNEALAAVPDLLSLDTAANGHIGRWYSLWSEELEDWLQSRARVRDVDSLTHDNALIVAMVTEERMRRRIATHAPEQPAMPPQRRRLRDL